MLERMLVALKDRIPLKLKQEDAANGKGLKGPKERVQVDVFRGGALAPTVWPRSRRRGRC
mgnify:CR=1 FL=1